MNSLSHELQRLYCHPDVPCQQATPGGSLQATPLTDQALSALAGKPGFILPLQNAQGLVRTLTLTLNRNQDWHQLAALYAALEQDLALPLPALAVLATGGFQLWFSLDTPIEPARGHAFLAGLQSTYLAQVPSQWVKLQASVQGNETGIELVPNHHAASDCWSAFIDPALGGMFADEVGLDVPPNPEGQANILARFRSIKADDLQRAEVQLQTAVTPVTTAVPTAAIDSHPHSARLSVDAPFTDPKAFLLAVMNSPATSGELRVKAAAALLPYYEKPKA